MEYRRRTGGNATRKRRAKLGILKGGEGHRKQPKKKA